MKNSEARIVTSAIESLLPSIAQLEDRLATTIVEKLGNEMLAISERQREISPTDDAGMPTNDDMPTVAVTPAAEESIQNDSVVAS